MLVHEGKVTASGPLTEVLTRNDLPLANADNAISVIEATVKNFDEKFGLTSLDAAGSSFLLPRQDLNIGSKLRISVRARDVSITKTAPENTSILNILPSKIAGVSELGESMILVRLVTNGVPFLSRITRKSADTLNLQVGDSVFAQIKSVASLN